MRTPIWDFVRRYADADPVRFHMPGHKGCGALGCEPLDITEIHGADVLSHAEGIIAESEASATALFGTAHSFYSTEGSTLAIKTMLALVIAGAKRGERSTVLAARNAHKAFVYAAALLDFDVHWIYPESAEHLCGGQPSADEVDKLLSSMEQKPVALYLTSPDYLGNMADVASISTVCKRYGVPLLVDNAHGAYLQFLSPSRHPIALGATMCCDSAHKTLPVLTGGAYLHVSRDADAAYIERARATMAVFATTSPSYLILSSLDLCNRYLADGYAERLAESVARLERVRKQIADMGFSVSVREPQKLVIDAARAGYAGDELADRLREGGVEVEFSDRDVVVLMASPENTDRDYERLCALLSAIPIGKPNARKVLLPEAGERCMSIREAIFARRETVSVGESLGRICATPTVSCPPAIPIAISGERIGARAVAIFSAYGIDQIDVVVE